MFDPDLKEKSELNQFPKDCKKDYEIGQRLSIYQLMKNN